MTTAEESRTRTRWWHEAVTAVPDEAAAETAESEQAALVAVGKGRQERDPGEQDPTVRGGKGWTGTAARDRH